MDLSIHYLIASCDKFHASGRRHLLNLEHLVMLLAGTILTLGSSMWILSKFSISYWIHLLFILLILMGVELLLCLPVTLS